jgi:hypothetical protein
MEIQHCSKGNFRRLSEKSEKQIEKTKEKHTTSMGNEK